MSAVVMAGNDPEKPPQAGLICIKFARHMLGFVGTDSADGINKGCSDFSLIYNIAVVAACPLPCPRSLRPHCCSHIGNC